MSNYSTATTPVSRIIDAQASLARQLGGIEPPATLPPILLSQLLTSTLAQTAPDPESTLQQGAKQVEARAVQQSVPSPQYQLPAHALSPQRQQLGNVVPSQFTSQNQKQVL